MQNSGQNLGQDKIATIFGGTGFVGRQIVRELAKRGVRIKVATRAPERAYFLKPAGTVGQVVPIQCNPKDVDSINAAIKGSDYVINCIGALFEKGLKQNFKYLHTDLPAIIASACAKADVERFVHISSLGVDQATSKYAVTKLDGENAIHSNFPNATILRPSVIFSDDDSFFNMFASMSRVFPALPLIGGGKTKFQPVFVGDVADATIAALTNPDAKAQTYELGGPDIVTFKEIYELVFKYTGHKRCLINLPFGIAKVEAAFLSLLPKPPLTVDQVQSLKTDNIVNEDAQTFKELGIDPTPMSLILPTYLESYRDGGRFADINAG